ncbi:uncharacterized protein LOC110452374 [Mizuhopecten yessoensis]|uniref:uncharacterized protein LOC110452374 n=1 Tax=Mizuhopecten yessoensis TaxID=6573 RepID=UPI000B45955B|nr:uncharacterized protein LOC110452374 [Mizuhopecten yessoensis]
MAEMAVTANMRKMAVAEKRTVKADVNISYGVEKECRVALIGRSGTGKSVTGNNILGWKAFRSELSASSVTSRCEINTAERFGKKLVVVDTPGLYDTALSNEDITKEIVKCIAMLAPGPHAFILVVQVGRITPEEQNTITHFSNVFGEEFFKYLIVLFTRKDDLENDDMTIDEYIKKVPDKLKDILQRCGRKYLAFDNSPRGRKTGADALELVEKVQDIVNGTGTSYYSNEMFEKAEQEFQRRAEEFRLEEKKKIDKEQKKIQKDLETEQKKIESQRKEVEARRMKIQATEFELQKKEKKKSHEFEETLRKQEAAKKDLEAKEREIEEREIKNDKLESRRKRDLEKREKEFEEKCGSYRDDFRKECEKGDESFMVGLMNSVGSAVVAVGNAAEKVADAVGKVGNAIGNIVGFFKEKKYTSRINKNMAEMAVTETMTGLAVTENMTGLTDVDISYGAEKEYRMALIGRTGTGKSATGNNILGRKDFVSKLSGSSVTSRCGFNTTERFGKKLVVVDTPGLFDTALSNEDITKEIVKCIAMLAPGPHAFILVVQVGRITPEEQNTITHFSNVFGEEFFKYLIVLFTRKDDLENDDMTIHEYIKKVPDKLKDILQRCGQKYLAFDNSPRGQKTGADALELVEKVQDMNGTGKSYYSNEMFEKAEQEFQRRAEEFRLEEKKKIDKAQKKIQEDLETEQKKIESQRKEVEASRKEIQAKELELQTKEKEKSQEFEETLRKQKAAKKELEAKEREIEEKENRQAELESMGKRELEKRMEELQEKCVSYRDDYRKECENGNKTIMGRLMIGAAQSIGGLVGTIGGAVKGLLKWT